MKMGCLYMLNYYRISCNIICRIICNDYLAISVTCLWSICYADVSILQSTISAVLMVQHGPSRRIKLKTRDTASYTPVKVTGVLKETTLDSVA